MNQSEDIYKKCQDMLKEKKNWDRLHLQHLIFCLQSYTDGNLVHARDKQIFISS